ncbi:Oidioi.mRNA.OKI2018_I69.XSR.g14384.t1.cds [Oikopleura dioica]|uniref:Dynein regulatory complex protein 1 n=1 Tax=Oikopleura dioica TaxID=34765 RepID=A0ABN7SEJ9_OIKDI|nr:Oidioi.mRNA.OKI2018_I69.XSR.g14384.t1.cds [Oikopleura dioica]
MQERRDRIKQRVRAKEQPDLVIEEEKKQIDVNPQMKVSEGRLALLRKAGTELVSNVEIAAVAREFERRKEVHEEKKRRMKILADEADANLEKFEAIRRRWTGSLARDVPQELRDALTDQCKACEEVLSAKNQLIVELNRELKCSEDEYVKTLKKQYDDLDIITQRMVEQYRTMDRAFRDEAKQVIAALDAQFKDVEATDLWREKAAHLSKTENNYLEDRFELRDELQSEIDRLRLRDAEDLHTTKIKLETDVQVLEQQLESMRASYQLNQEKLEYNFQVLKKRDDENTITNSQQKRRLTKMQDQLNSLRSKLEAQEKKARVEGCNLREDYRRLLQQYADFQKKKKHFEDADNKKFREVWEMNMQELMELVNRTLQADKIISEQQLGVDFVMPEYNKSTSKQHRPSAMDIPKKQADQAFDLLCSECSFLVEAMLNKLIEPLKPEEKRLILIDAIFAALNIDDESELKLLMAEMTNYGAIGEKADPNNALEGILSYINNAMLRRKKTSLTSSNHSKGDIKWEVWEERSHIINDKKLILWNALYKAQQSYFECLNQRASLVSDNESLQTQNEELRVLLHQYVTMEVNKDLQVPPNRVLNIQ